MGVFPQVVRLVQNVQRLLLLYWKENMKLPILTQSDAPEVVHQKDGTWWFWDECYIVEFGPYDSPEQAHKACSDYCTEVLGYPEG